MRNTVIIAALSVVCSFIPATPEAAGTAEIGILTYPIGLVTGRHEINVDLGPGGEPATLFLDGEPVCSMDGRSTSCEVDFGAAPHVHLLELVRLGDSGEVLAHASRWVNRPGQEAELVIQMSERNSKGICSGKALWSHPSKRDPVLLEVTENGRILRIRSDGRSFAFPCPDPDEPHVLSASAIFPDGKRAEAVALSGGFGGRTEAGLTAMALTSAGAAAKSCGDIAAAIPGDVKVAESVGFEVVFVLDPTAGYRTLMANGWTKGAMPTITSTTKQFDSLVQQGSKGSDARPKNTWKRAESSLIDAEKMWFVLSNENLQRANGFGQGKPNWFLLLFNYGSATIEGKPRIADAVAASGLVAAAGPRRRAVVLILGNHPERDRSQFTAEQAQRYLAEVGVPLFVLRNGKLRDDGWPEGVPVRTMEAMAESLEAVAEDLDGQCVTWFPGDMHPSQIVASLPDDVALAGRTGEAFRDVEEVWRQADLSAGGVDDEAGAATAAGAASGSRIDVTAVKVMFAAVDDDGRPVTDLERSEVTVAEDGRPVAVLALEPMLRPTSGAPETAEATATAGGGSVTDEPETADVPVAVWVDRNLASSAEIQGALEAIAGRSGWLTRLGPVDVVVADREIVRAVEGETDADAVRAELLELARKPAGQHAIESIRTRFLRDIRTVPNRLVPDNEQEDDTQGPMARLQSGQDVQEFERSKVLTAARASLFEEDAVLRRAMTRIADWALSTGREGPRLLLLVGAGFDVDPVDFYLPFVERAETHLAPSAREEFKQYRQTARVDSVGDNLAGAGWLVIPVATRTTGSAATSAEIGGGDRFQQFLSAQPDAVRTAEAGFLLLDPLGAQRHLAEPSGGEVVMGGDGLDKLIASSEGWYRVSYQIDRPPDGANHRLEISSGREDVSIRSASFVASETVEGEAAARVRRLLRGGDDEGGLQVAVTVTDSQPAAGKQVTAEASITVDLAPVADLMVAGGRRNVRVSVAVRAGDHDPFLMHRIESVDGKVDRWGYRVPLQWPKGAATLAVAVEDLGTGAWGGAVTAIR